VDTTLGYFGMPDRTVEAFRNLWFHTGDGLRRDEDGWYYFVDRLKDALRRRGENISSYEVGVAHPRAPRGAECAVVAVPADHAAGEDEVLAAVVTAPGSELTVRGPLGVVRRSGSRPSRCRATCASSTHE
jgi:carnitine-CoA ligase